MVCLYADFHMSMADPLATKAWSLLAGARRPWSVDRGAWSVEPGAWSLDPVMEHWVWGMALPFAALLTRVRAQFVGVSGLADLDFRNVSGCASAQTRHQDERLAFLLF